MAILRVSILNYYDVIMLRWFQVREILSSTSRHRHRGLECHGMNESLLRIDLLSGQRCVSGGLGWISFGGTAAHIAIMQDELGEG